MVKLAKKLMDNGVKTKYPNATPKRKGWMR